MTMLLDNSAKTFVAAIVLCGCLPSNKSERATCHEPHGVDVDLASSFVVLPDTQFYACAYPEIFVEQTRWIVAERIARGIGLVLHTGDIVDANSAYQWENAAAALHSLDGEVAYLLVPGNHDIDLHRSTPLDMYFRQKDWVGPRPLETMCFREREGVQGSFAIVTLGRQPWLFLGLEFGPRDQEIDWANRVLHDNAELPAVVFTHAFLYSDGTRYDRSLSPLQPFHPDLYGVTPEQGIADGQDIWESVVEPNRNVRLVLSGHVIPDGVARSEARRDDGSLVHQVLANYQTCDLCPCAEVEGGGGYLRIFTLSEDGRSLSVQTYSPHRDHYLSDEENEFVLAL